MFPFERILNIISFPTVCSALKKEAATLYNTPLNFNMEPEHMPLERSYSLWKLTFSGSMSIFCGVTPNSKDLQLRESTSTASTQNFWIGVAMSESDSLSSDSSDSGTSDEVQWIGDG